MHEQGVGDGLYLRPVPLDEHVCARALIRQEGVADPLVPVAEGASERGRWRLIS